MVTLYGNTSNTYGRSFSGNRKQPECSGDIKSYMNIKGCISFSFYISRFYWLKMHNEKAQAVSENDITNSWIKNIHSSKRSNLLS